MTDDTHDNQEGGLFGTLLPYMLLTAALTLGAAFTAIKYLPEKFLPATGSYGEAPAVVTFDVVKYTNAQRAVASAFLKPGNDPQAVNELLINLSDRTREAIGRHAGPGTLVLVKQGVVQGQLKDITDEVLVDLKLPVKEIPTSNGVEFVLDYAPTMLMQVPTMREFAGPKAAKKPSSAEAALP